MSYTVYGQSANVGVGLEIRESEKELTSTPIDKKTDLDSLPSLPKPSTGMLSSFLNFFGSADISLDEERPPVNLGERITISGDWHILVKENLWEAFSEALLETTSGSQDANRVAAEYSQTLIDRGYLLMAISANADEDHLSVVVDAGRFGDLQIFKTTHTDDGTPIREPYKGRYFSERQIRRMLDDFSNDAIFYYPSFYSRMYEANLHPDLTLDTKLRLRRGKRRYADIEVTASEKLPIHAILDVNNTGTESTEKWRAGLTLQHLNLLRREDVLTFRSINATDFTSMNSFSLSYRQPYRAGNGGAISLFGGYSQIDSDEIAPEIRIQGSGWFVGGQTSYRLIDSPRSVCSIGMGSVYRMMEDQLVFAETEGRPREAEAFPLSFSISYAAKRNDRLLGRNYVTFESAINAGSWIELSSDEAFNDLRQDATEDYTVYRLQLARLQSLDFKATGTPARDWSLFFKFEGQYADGALIPAEQFAVGGANTVRGYEERALLGDHGGFATLELRSPIFQNILTRVRLGRKEQAENRNIDRIQGLLFADGGFISRAELLQGEERTESIYSLGLGIRWSFSRFAQLRADAGYRFEDVLEEEPGVGGHIRFQMQY
jgi:hemolysin activation/secretion protein